MSNGRRATDHQITQSINSWALPIVVMLLGVFSYQWLDSMNHVKEKQGEILERLINVEAELKGLRR